MLDLASSIEPDEIGTDLESSDDEEENVDDDALPINQLEDGQRKSTRFRIPRRSQSRLS